ARPLQHEPHNGDEADQNTNAGELTKSKLLRRFIKQYRFATGQRLLVEEGEDDGDAGAERREEVEARVTLGCVEMAGHAEDGEAERREDLNEEQHCRSLRSVGETAFEKVHPALLCRSTRRVMSSRGTDVSSAVARWIGLSELDGLNNRRRCG